MPEAPRSLALVVHFHQPVGNLEQVMRHAASRCYLPFLETIATHPQVPWTLHYSGCLLRWLEANAPAVPELLRRLVEAGQVELLTGGMEEPILASIPERDRGAQIKRMSAHLQAAYQAEARGLWLTERVWEPELARTLAQSGVQYTVIDDSSLRAVGIPQEQMDRSWLTDFEGETVRLFVASRQLRYLIPYGHPDTVLAAVEGARPGGLMVYADDGEKFGEWPHTYRQVYQRGWLERFLTAVEAAQDRGRVQAVQLGEAATQEPAGRVHVPSCSYDEMMVWALPTPARRHLEGALSRLRRADPMELLPYLRGAPWQGFLAKYPEVARLHQAMLRVSRQVELAGSPVEAVEELHLAQCNCAYWHGTFGGAYLTFLRLALWQHLVRAERQASIAMGSHSDFGVEVGDFDADGFDEVRLRAPWGYATVSPHLGGQVVELISWDGEANLIAVMGRHQESYHLPEEEPSGLESELELAPLAAPAVAGSSALEFDEVEIGALRDSIGGRWLDQPYQYRVGPMGVDLWWQDERMVLRKQIRVGSQGLLVSYSVEARGTPWQGSLTVEVRSCPLAPGRKADQVRARRTRTGWAVAQPGARSALAIDPDRDARVEATLVLAQGSTLKGVEAMYQGVSLKATWAVGLDAGGRWEAGLELGPLSGVEEPPARRKGH
ncbi:MAG: alpha-amylase/4-alpha-glucanotransferase domain-containing protein [Candidatus Dormibacteria bacterium]